MKYQCNIIQDLMPLYLDGVCSEDSYSAVEDHLHECRTCSEFLEELKVDEILPPSKINTEQAKAAVFSKMKQRLLHKKIIVSVVSALCAIAVMFGAFSFINLYEMPIYYEDGLVTVEIAYDGGIDAVYQGRDYNCAYGMTKSLTKDGKKVNVAYMYYTNSLWTKYFSRKHIPGTMRFSFGNGIMVDYANNGETIDTEETIDALYYLVGDYSKTIQLDDEEFSKAAKDAILIWER